MRYSLLIKHSQKSSSAIKVVEQPNEKTWILWSLER